MLGLFLSGCGGIQSSSQLTESGNSCALPETANAAVLGGPNVLAVGVGTTNLCGSNINIPCTTVTICEPGTNNCQTISDILVDTGSFGLRIFSSVVSLSLPSVTDTKTGNPLAECAQFGSATDWGSVVSTDVILGGESPVTVPMQLIDNSFGTANVPPTCASAETGTAQAGINGILGVGLQAQDCGTGCAGNIGFENLYYYCSGGTCTPTTATLAQQVTNPVSALPVDNNGVILNMPAVPPGGATSVTGSLILGIDTEANNSSAGFTVYPANNANFFDTQYNGATYTRSFIDSGSNVYLLSNPNWSTCSSGFYCTGEYTQNTAEIIGVGETSQQGISTCFTVGDANVLFSSDNAALSDVAADLGFADSFDWGMPFFYGREVFVGIQNTSSNLGSGPYWAF